jgi:hypothetical protein
LIQEGGRPARYPGALPSDNRYHVNLSWQSFCSLLFRIYVIPLIEEVQKEAERKETERKTNDDAQLQPVASLPAHIPVSSQGSTSAPTVSLVPFAPLSVLLSSPPLTLLILVSATTVAGRPITSSITVDPATRPRSWYRLFCVSLHCRSRDRRPPSITIEFWIALPQTILATEPATDHVRHNLQQHFNSTPASVPQAFSTLLVRKTDLDALSADDELALLGSETSHDTLSEYDALDCYSLFTPIQLQTLLLHNPILPVPAPAPVLLSLRMTAVLASTNDPSSSYVGYLEFLDFQAEFDRNQPIDGATWDSSAKDASLTQPLCQDSKEPT